MPQFLKRLFLAFCMAASLIPMAYSADIPMLDSKELSGQSMDLDAYVGKGKWTLVMFWATDCVICEQQKPLISAFHDKHKDDYAEVVGVAIDGYKNIDAINRYVEQHKPSFPTLVAELPVLAMNYQIATEEQFRGTPTYWMFNPEGELVGNNPGPVRIEALESFMAKHSN